MNRSGGGPTAAATGAASGPSASQVERRRAFANAQKVRRSVYRDVTTFRMFPLQAMAMDDHDVRLRDYFGADESDGSDEGDSDSDDGGSDGAQRRRRQDRAGDGTSSSLALECELRRRFRREFLKERSIPMTAAEDVRPRGQFIREKQEHSDGSTRDKNDPSTASDEDGGVAADSASTETASSDDKENVPHQKPAKHSDESKDETQLDLTPDEEKQQKQPKAESIISSPSTEDLQNEEDGQQFLPTLWSMEPRIFAMETALKGKRRYVSAHLGRFMDHYWRECDVYNRHYYELIKEATPCRLYFDLEFNKRSNPELTPAITEVILTELFDELSLQFHRIYDISITRSCMVDLDSSTPKKFSRHWILHLPDGELFSDAREAGVFVKILVARLEEEKESGELQSRGRELLAKNLFVNAEDSEEGEPKPTRFIDLGVYTRNRIFRLLGSTKFGKPADAALRIAEANEFPFPAGFDNTKFYLPEQGRGPTIASDEGEGVDCDDDEFRNFCNSLSFEDHAAAMACTLVVPANASKVNYPILDDPSNLLSDDERQQMMSWRVNGSGTAGALSKFPRAAPQYGQSPSPKLEHFILNTLGRRKGLVGSIGTWSLGTQQPLPQTVCYNMKDNRFCDNIGRAHKSNNIIWNVHLIDRVCWQSCHDPECRGYRGEPIDLPEEVNLEIDEYFIDFELSSFNENEAIGINGPRPSEENSEFDDPTLEAAMRQLDISSVGKGMVENDLDNQLAQLSLSDIVIRDGGTEKHPSNDAQSSLIMKPEEAKSVDPETSEPWEDDNLDSELAKLNLSSIVSSNSGP